MNIKKLNEELKKVLNEYSVYDDEYWEEKLYKFLDKLPNRLNKSLGKNFSADFDGDSLFVNSSEHSDNTIFIEPIEGSTQMITIGVLDDSNMEVKSLELELDDFSKNDVKKIADITLELFKDLESFSNKEDKGDKKNKKTFADWFGQDLTGQTYEGDIDCRHSSLKSLQGAPEKVNGNFNCSHNNLTSLQGAPKYVGGDFDCCDNKLTNLKGAPKYVGGDFPCYDNKLKSLEGIGEVKGNIYSPI